MSSVRLWKSNTYCSLTDPHASLWLAPHSGHLLCLRVTIWLVCSLFTTQIHALLFHWFTCLLLFGTCIDHCLVHVSPFNWYACQIILQIIILNFVITGYKLKAKLLFLSLNSAWNSVFVPELWKVHFHSWIFKKFIFTHEFCPLKKKNSEQNLGVKRTLSKFKDKKRTFQSSGTKNEIPAKFRDENNSLT